MEHLRLPGPGYDLDLATHLREHLVWMRLCGRADDTLAARRRAMVRLAEHLGHDAATATYAELYAWQIHLYGSRAQTSPDTALTYVRWNTALIRPYYGYLHDHGVRADNPAALLPLPAAKRGVPRPMAEPKVMDMIGSAPPRLLPWLLLAAWSGLRAAEIAGLRVDDFTVDAHGEVWVRVLGKGGHERNAAVPAWCWDLIAPQLPERGRCWRMLRRRGGHLGLVTAQHVSQYCNDFLHKKMGIPDTLHSLRHRFGTLTYEQTEDVRLVQDMLGHAQLSTTQVYTRVNPRRAAAAVNELPRPTTLPRTAPRHLHVVDDAHGGTA